jgi:AraC-like DNA-binding protein
MRFEFGFYSSLLLIFFVHGLVYCILLMRKAKKNDTVSDYWLAFFLLLCICYIAPWMLGFGGWYDNQPYRDIIFYVPFQQLFFIGPAVFFYVQTLLNPSFQFRKKDYWHFVPGVLYFLFSVTMFVVDKLILKRYYFLESGMDPDFDLWYQVAGFVSMLLYFIYALRYYSMFKRLMFQVVSYAETLMFVWVRNFLMAFLLMLGIKLLFFIGGFIPAFSKYNYVGDWWQYFSFAIVFYYIAITGYSNTVETKIAFKLNLLQNKSPLLLLHSGHLNTLTPDETEDADYVEIEAITTIAQEDDLQEWKQKVTHIIETELLYEDPELTLTQLAKKLQTNPSFLSKVINQGFALNFNDYINQYRVEAVKRLLIAGEQKKQTLLGIAYDCGFNSKATFNRSFKKATGQSPKDWMGEHLKTGA